MHDLDTLEAKSSHCNRSCENHSCPTLCDPIDCSLPGSSVHEILQARILEWVVVPFSRDFPNPGIKPRPPALQADFLPSEPFLVTLLNSNQWPLLLKKYHAVIEQYLIKIFAAMWTKFFLEKKEVYSCSSVLTKRSELKEGWELRG